MVDADAGLPDSISASVPSSTAFATSETSARVGREAVIIESNIWVATMTGLPARRQLLIACFCSSGTSSSGSSTPRSPWATMIPSKAEMMESRLATACGFSILASTGTRVPISDMISRTLDTSSPVRTAQRHDVESGQQRPPQVGRVLVRQRRHTHRHPGRFSPLWSDTTPPSTTSVCTSAPSTSNTRRPPGRRRSGCDHRPSRRREGRHRWSSSARQSPQRRRW